LKTNNLQNNESLKESILPNGYSKNHKYSPLRLTQKKYFLFCNICYWTASTLHHLLDNRLIHHKKCPICKNDIDKFSIPQGIDEVKCIQGNE
jgi:hypothetical protein